MHPIEKYRKAKGLTQGELAQQVGVSLNSVQLWEKGTEPRPRHRLKAAEVLGVDPLQLLNEIEVWKQHGTAAA